MLTSPRALRFHSFVSLPLILAITAFTSQARAQAVDTFGWDVGSNYSGDLSFGGVLNTVTVSNPGGVSTVITVISAASSPFVNPTSKEGIDVASGLSPASPTGLWHSVTWTWSDTLMMNGVQGNSFDTSVNKFDFDGFLTILNGSDATMDLTLSGGAVFDSVSFSLYGDNQPVSGLGTSHITLTPASFHTGQVIFTPIISGSFNALTIALSDVTGNLTVDTPSLYYSAGSASVVPEPASLALIATAGIAGLARRRRNI